jgi:nucleotide-binding universal stress UspA family protein
MIKRIMVALSGTPFTKVAIRRGIELAQRHGAELTGVTIVDPKRLTNVGPVPVGGQSAAAELVEHRKQVTTESVEESIAMFESGCRKAGLIGVIDREEGDPLQRLSDRWRYNDLMIFGLRSMFEYGVVHNPDDTLARIVTHGISPIIAVSDHYRQIRRVLIAYNGSIVSSKAMKRFAQMRPWDDVQVKVASFGFEPDKAEPLLDDARTYLKVYGFDPETQCLESNPREGLVQHAADWNADLIVMGAAARSRLAKLILGDTALGTLANANLPLFLAS